MSEIERTELYNGQVVIEFNPKGHKYTVTDKGKSFKPPSVTSITGVIDKSGPISGWAVNVTLDAIKNAIHPNIPYDSETLEKIWAAAKKQHYFQKKEAADIGTNAHKWLQLYFAGKNPELPSKELPYRLSIDAALDWVKKCNVKFIQNERPVYSRKYKFSGRLDGIAEVDGIISIVDFKTGGLYDEVKLQTSAYNCSYEEETKEVISQRCAIRIGKQTGQFCVAVYPRAALKTDYKAFLGAMSLYNWLQNAKIDSKKEHDDWIEQ